MCVCGGGASGIKNGVFVWGDMSAYVCDYMGKSLGLVDGDGHAGCENPREDVHVSTHRGANGESFSVGVVT